MLPQIYQTTDDKKLIDDIKTIYKKNKDSNDEILTKRENNKFDVKTDFKVINHLIGKIPDNFGNLSLLESFRMNNNKITGIFIYFVLSFYSFDCHI